MSRTGRLRPVEGIRKLAPIPLVLMLLACGEATEPDPSPAADGGPYNMIDPVPTPAAPGADLEAAGLSAGNWRASLFEGARAIAFLDGGQNPLFRMHCDGRGGIILDRLQREAVGKVERMEIQLDGNVTRLAVNELETQTPTLRSAIRFNHDLLEKLGRPEGLLSIRAGETAPLLLPLTAATAEFVRGCEKPDRPAPAPAE